MAEEQQVTTNESQQVTKEPQQVMKEPQQVTTKNLKKVEVSKRLAEYSRRKREELKAQKQNSEGPSGVSQYYSVGAVIAVGVIGGLGYYIYRTKKGKVVPHNPTVSQQPSPQTNKFEMD